jgi:hypothetical protein
MGKIGISIYSLRIYDGNAQEVELHNIIAGKGIVELTKEFILQNINAYVDDTSKESIFKFVDWKIQQSKVNGNELFTSIYGRLKTGDYGVESEIVNKDTGAITHHVSANEAKVMPFDFCISLGGGTDGNTVGLAILQTNGSYGIKTIFEHKLKEYIQNQDRSKVLNFGMIYPKEYLNNFIHNGRLKKIELFKYEVPIDIANRVGINRGSKKTKLIFTIQNPIGFIQQRADRIKEFMDGQRVYSSIIEMPDFDYDDLKLEFQWRNTVKKFSLRNLEKVVITDDITERVVLDGGNPTKESILPILLDTSNEYLCEMGIIEDINAEIAITNIEQYEQ